MGKLADIAREFRYNDDHPFMGAIEVAVLILEIDGKRSQIELQEGLNTIGRLPENTIQLHGFTVSGKHARIVGQGGEFYLEDVGSRNGTFVNQKKLSDRVKLNHNDSMHFGQTPARFVNRPVSKHATGSSLELAGSQSVDTGLLAHNDLPPRSSGKAKEGSSTITGTVSSSGRFGVLEVNSEEKLKAVLEISSALAGTVDLKSLLPKILDTLFRIFKYADRGCVLLKDEATGKMVPRAFRHRQRDRETTVRLSRTIVNKVMAEKAAVLSADASSEFNESQSITDLKIRSMMCAPLLALNGEPAGIISIDSQNPLGQFTNEDLEILMTVAGQAALSYETARLMQSYLAKQRQDNEMKIAQNVQRALLPTELPKVDGYEFYASYDSAQAVGGDYYDCFVLADNKIALSFGDVAGKGVPGALIMSRISSCVQSTLRHVSDLKSAMFAINEHMCDSAVEGRFVTFVLCIVDAKRHQLTLSNAGHMSPIVRRADRSIELFDENLVGPPVGVAEDYPYEAETHLLAPGDMVVIVTDGVDEAMNPGGELYGTARAIEFIKNGPPTAEQLGKALLADVRRHADGRPQNDDITIMAFGRNP